MEISKFSRADILMDVVVKGAYPGVETPVTPVEPDVLDAGDVVGGVGRGGLASGCQVWRVGWCFKSRRSSGGGAVLHRLPERQVLKLELTLSFE